MKHFFCIVLVAMSLLSNSFDTNAVTFGTSSEIITSSQSESTLVGRYPFRWGTGDAIYYYFDVYKDGESYYISYNNRCIYLSRTNHKTNNRQYNYCVEISKGEIYYTYI